MVLLSVSVGVAVLAEELNEAPEAPEEPETIQIGTINEPGTNKVGVVLRKDATRDSDKITTLSHNTIVTVLGSKADIDNSQNAATGKAYIWYQVNYTSGATDITGYIREDLIVVTTHTINKSFEEQLKEFPESYHDALKKLHAQYPNWVFTADNVDITFQEAIALESVYPRKVVMDKNAISWASMENGWYNWSTNTFSTADKSYKGASREVIAYYMDPRNFLDANNVYVFMKQSYDPASQTIEGVRKIIEGRFLATNYNDPNDTAYGGDYAAVIMEAGKQSGVSPYILASTIIQEQGTDGGTLAHGYSYNNKTVYNFFNFGASGNSSAEIITNSAKYAYNKGWTTRSASIIGGAKLYADGYLNRGTNDYDPPNAYYNQDTYFYKNFNILDKKHIWHQYAQNIADSVNSAKNLNELYSTDYQTVLTFRIPVYKNNSLPENPSILPTYSTTLLNNYYLNIIEVEGLTPSFSRYVYSYAFEVDTDTTVYAELHGKATLASETEFDLINGENKVIITVKSETGFTNNYTLTVKANAPCKLTIITEKPTPPPTNPDGEGDGNTSNPDDTSSSPDTSEPSVPEVTDPPKPTIIRGDANNDGKISISDLAAVKLHILKSITLTDDNFTGADANRDGKISVSDLAAIKLHILKSIDLTTIS